ncbi:MAG TPA: DUF6034 family protein [Clostridia bacterium]|nr:DUF6034 family protein [Clostridia bacterium]
MLAALISATAFSACQATPEQPLVVGKTNDGWEAHAAESNEAPAPYQAPERYEKTFTADDLTVEFDADVILPDVEKYPIYIMEPLTFTQEMADRIIPVLLDGVELYDETNYRTKEYVQEKIDYYTEELEAAIEGNYEQLIADYQEILTDLIKELETAPDDPARTPASRELMFKDVGNTLVSTYGKRVDLEDGGYQYMWTEEGRRKAAAAGNAAIDGVCEQASGRKMYLLFENSVYGNRILFSRDSDDGRGWFINPPEFDQAEARRQADAFLEKLGLPFDYLCTMRVEDLIQENGGYYYALSYCTAVEGAPSQRIESSRMNDYATVGRYSQPLWQETVTVSIDGSGLNGFSWDAPAQVKALDMENAALLPWAAVTQIMGTMLEAKNLWCSTGDAGDAHIVGRRLYIDKITLSWMQVRKDAELEERYYIPVWDVCGKLYYRYDENYDPLTDPGGGVRVNENHEWDTDYGQPPEIPLSYLTINAIDGSVIDRDMGY